MYNRAAINLRCKALRNLRKLVVSMAAAADELSQNLRDQFLQCKICLDGLKDPKTLPCLHTFCAECIVYYVDYNRLDSRKFACPICRRHIYIPKDGIDGFPDSFFVQSLTDALQQSTTRTKKSECNICRFKEGSVESKVLCVDCKIELCHDCARDHSEAKITENHTLLQLQQSPLSLGSGRENYCRIHKGETVKYYCETCNSPICLPCTFLDHKGHLIEEIKNVRQNFSLDMSRLVMTSEDNIIQLQTARNDLAELESELFVRKEAVKSQIRRTVQDLIKSVQEHENRLLTEVDTFYDTVSVATDRQKVEKIIFRLETAHDFASQLLSSDTSPITQLVNRTEAKENLRQAQAYELPDITVHEEKLSRYICYLPGMLESSVGSVIKCASEPSVCSMSLRPALPTNRAIFLQKCRLPKNQAPLSDVTALAFLPNQDLVVLNSTKKFVKIFTPKGRLRYEFGDESDLIHPCDVAITRDGEIAIADCGYLCVKVYDSYGTLRFTFGDADTFGLPIALTVDLIGRFLVCDQAKQCVTVHRQHGQLLQTMDVPEIACPCNIHSHGNKLYLCDSLNSVVCIYIYSKDGLQFVAKMAASASSLVDFLDCSGICVDPMGNLLISDSILGRLHVVNGNGEIRSVTASGKAFLRPIGIAISSDGLLAVAQQGTSLEPVTSCDSIDGQQGTSHDQPEVVVESGVDLYRLVKADL